MRCSLDGESIVWLARCESATDRGRVASLVNLVVDTWSALNTPRRAVPIALVSSSLIATEAWATQRVEGALLLAVFCLVFVVVVPAAWRAWNRSIVGLMGYFALVVAIVVATTLWIPWGLGYESYVLHPPALVALVALVLIAGWVLGRDIELAGAVGLLSREAEDARLLAIRQHLDPHFLFNTLGAIAEWCREDPAVAEKALLELSAMLRTLFDGIREPMWPLQREVELLIALHGLYALRDDERYRLETDLQVPDTRVPPLVLLPLFENGLTHGTTDAPMRLEVDTKGVRIWNAGVYEGRREGGTGIATAERRLGLVQASLQIERSTRTGVDGTLVTVRL